MMPATWWLTPNWCWHGHGNDSRACRLLARCADVPLVQLPRADVLRAAPQRVRDGDRGAEYVADAFRVGRHAAAAGRGRKSANGKPAEVALGDPALATIGLSMIGLKAGRRAAPRKVMAKQRVRRRAGRGCYGVDGQTLEWTRGDVIVVPGWQEHMHRSQDGAVLFRCTDEPVMEKLGFMREGNGAK